MLARRLLPALAVGLGLTVAARPAAACPFCAAQGQTLAGEVAQADFIVLGTLGNPQRDPNDITRGTTDLTVEVVVKPHDYLTGKKVLRLPRYIPVDATAKDTKFLVFCSLYTRPIDFTASAVTSAAALANPDAAQLDAYRGEAVPAGSRLGEYLKGAIEHRQKDPVARLSYYFDYLDNPDLVISGDALNEFAAADYKEVRALSEAFAAEKDRAHAKRVIAWLKDPNTPPSRFGLYALMAGHCGKPEDAKTIRALLDSPDRAYSSGLDGMLAAYVLLDKPAGWAYLVELLKDAKKEFPVRYAGLKVLRFFWEFRPDVVQHEKVLEGMRLLVQQADLADLPIEDLRKWECWSEAPLVLKLAEQQSHNAVPIVRRAILRFALAAPADCKQAKEYVEKVRREDPERVKFVEQTLKDESPAKPATQQASQPTPPAGGGK